MAEPIGSSSEFFAALGDVVRRYLQHFEPSANPEMFQARLEAQGPEFNVIYVKGPDTTPAMTFTLHADVEQPKSAKRWGDKS